MVNPIVVNIVKHPDSPAEAATLCLKIRNVNRKLIVGTGLPADAKVLNPNMNRNIGQSVFKGHGPADV